VNFDEVLSDSLFIIFGYSHVDKLQILVNLLSLGVVVQAFGTVNEIIAKCVQELLKKDFECLGSIYDGHVLRFVRLGLLDRLDNHGIVLLWGVCFVRLSQHAIFNSNPAKHTMAFTHLDNIVRNATKCLSNV
jgi:hypothetical protein